MNATFPACPVNGRTGKVVKLLTLKALLTPQALATLNASETYRFCSDSACPVVYYGASRSYQRADLKVVVFQKDAGGDVPVCYCFAYYRRDLEGAWVNEDVGRIPEVIRGHIQAGRCGCEVNNPQGSCCLGNVTRTINTAREGRGEFTSDPCHADTSR